MTIEAPCSDCGRTLRVDDQFAGKAARCPICGAVTQMPLEGESEPTIWRLRTPEGQIYGPVGKSELDEWAAGGRIDADCELSDDDKMWRAATDIFPSLAPIVNQAPATPAPATVVPASSAVGYLQPHRGGLIVTLGVLAWVTCPVFSVFAWVLGANDVREIRSGHMDPGGLPQTQTGMVLGMVNVILWMIAGLISVFVVLFVVAAR